MYVAMGSNPILASTYYEYPKNACSNIVLAVHWHKNHRNNVEKTRLKWASFLKISKSGMYSVFEVLLSVLVVSDGSLFNIQSYGGV